MMRTPADFDENAFPHSEQQPAIVKDNNDPLGMGRVRVQFLWQAKRNEMTPWIRVVQPYTGGGKGFLKLLTEEVNILMELKKRIN